MIESYRDLIVWQKSITMVKIVYKATKNFPLEERFGLLSQIRRSAVSIPSNIAEGKSRGTRKDYGRFLQIAFGSGAELETQILIAHQLGYIGDGHFEIITRHISEIMRMLNTLIHRLK
jgi:four helix bundle protein